MVITIKYTEQFFETLSEHADLDDYSYKYLKKVMTLICDRKVAVSPESFISEDENGWLLFIEIEGHLYLYGSDYSDDQVSQFANKIELASYSQVEIMGTMDLVYSVLKKSGIESFKLIKDRCFYRLLNYAGDPDRTGIQLAAPNDMDELLLMFQHYYQEEYKGERNKDEQTLRPMINRDIRDSSLYIRKEGNKIAAFCSILDPDIGIIFTKEEFRSRGIGKQLLEYCSSELFQDNGIVYIMTDMHNLASNKICKQIGYELIYTHTNVKI